MDANLSPRHSLVTIGGLFSSQASDATLGTFVPPPATVKLRDHLWHVAATEHATWTDRLLSESTIRIQSGDTTASPQGLAPMELLPETINGNFFNRQSRTTATYQWVGSVSSSSHEGPFGMRHLLKVGVDALHSAYDGTSASRPVLIERSDGTLARRLDFGADTSQHVTSTDVALFAQDRIQTGSRWYIEAGGRLDRDGILNQWNLTPRAGTAVVLDRAGNAVLRGGFGVFFERTPSAAGAFEQFESPIETRFAPNGVSPLAPPALVVRHRAPPADGAQLQLESELRAPPERDVVGARERARASRLERADGGSDPDRRRRPAAAGERRHVRLSGRGGRRPLHARARLRHQRDLRQVVVARAI